MLGANSTLALYMYIDYTHCEAVYQAMSSERPAAPFQDLGEVFKGNDWSLVKHLQSHWLTVTSPNPLL